MAKVKVLVKGYISSDLVDGEEKTCPTISLVQDKKLNIVVDPGTSDEITRELKKNGLNLIDINYVFITHSHFDHYKNVSLFSRAKIIEFYGTWEGGKLVMVWDEQLSQDIKIINTPGHSVDSLSMLVKTSKGIVAICGDVFWKENFPKTDAYATDDVKLKNSRKRILHLADYVIPGHGDIFKVKK